VEDDLWKTGGAVEERVSLKMGGVCGMRLVLLPCPIDMIYRIISLNPW
jgi:hypothetical protein